jgi:hypothetical protein
MHVPARLLLLPVMAQLPEQRPVTGMAGGFQIRLYPFDCIRRDGQGIVPAALAGDAQRVIAAILMQIRDDQRRDFGATEPRLQLHYQNGPVTQTLKSLLVRLIQYVRRIRPGKRQRRSFPAIDGGALDS